MARQAKTSLPRLAHEPPLLVRYGYPAAIAWVAVATILFLPIRTALAGGQWGWPFLLVVGVVASTSGLGPGLLAAVLSFLVENFFFIKPYGSLFVQQPEEFVQLLAFLVVALVWGWQAGRLRERELVALHNEAEASALVELASRVVSETSRNSMAAFLAAELKELLGTVRAIVWVIESGEAIPMGADAGASDGELEAARPYVRFVQRQSRAIGLPNRRPSEQDENAATPLAWPASVDAVAIRAPMPSTDLFLPLQTTAGLEGVLQVGWDEADRAQLRPEDYRLVVSAAQMVAAFLTGRRLASAEAQADAVREADRLKSAIVSSVSHELKTPLASITAVITDLLTEDVTRDPEQVRERLGSLTEDLRRLEGSIADLLDTSRLEAGQWHADVETWEAGEIIGDVISRMPEWARSHVIFEVAEPGPTVAADFAQLSRALATLLGNALAYGRDEPVVVGARCEEERTLLWVEDRGPGVPEAEKAHVFDKFYRGRAGLAMKGSTGLGLSIAREIVQANGGTLWVEDASPGPGARFVVSLPATASGDSDMGAASRDGRALDVPDHPTACEEPIT